jgi:heme exporter protein D
MNWNRWTCWGVLLQHPLLLLPLPLLLRAASYTAHRKLLQQTKQQQQQQQQQQQRQVYCQA